MKHILPLILALFPVGLIAQQNTVSSGGDATGSGGSVSFSIGQVDYNHASSSSGEVNQGVQQPYELFLVSLEEALAEAISVFPNPFTNQLILRVSEANGYHYRLLDASGRLVLEGNCQGTETAVDVSQLQSGNYQFTLFNASQQVLVYKLIKN